MYSLEPIATVHSCYTQRFGIPRQAGLVTSAQATITFTNNTHNALSLRGLDAFSHIWVIFIFHKDHYDKPKPLVQPPRLGGKKSIGVYATRSPNRLNALGLSCVQLDSIARTDKDIDLHIIGGDFLDGTPVVDIKPYLPFADSIETASCGWAAPPTDTLAVQWHDTAAAALQALCVQGQPDYETARRVIEDTVAQDPRPAHERNRDGRPDQQWHMQIYHCDISFEVKDGQVHIVDCRPV